LLNPYIRAVATALVLFLFGSYATYWVVWLAVTHGMRDALRSEALSRAELDELADTSMRANDA
jgi:hypothetical protein